MLHGTIDVNGHVIGEWTAENTGEKFLGDVAYICQVTYTDNAGYPHEFNFIKMHNPGDGALVLAWGIMQKAAEKMKATKNRSEQNCGQD